MILWIACIAPAPDGVPDMPTWTADIQPMMEDNCTNCHQFGGRKYEGVATDSYLAVSAAAVKNICTSVGPDVVDAYSDLLLPLAGQQDQPACGHWELLSMPPGAQAPLTTTEQWTFARWLEVGTPE